MRDITLGQFVAGDSVIHKLDPRTKIGMMILYILMTFLVKKIYFLAIPFAYLVIELVLSGISLRYILNSLKPIRFLLIFMFLLNLFFTKGEHVWLDLGFWQLTGEAVLQSCFLAAHPFAALVNLGCGLDQTAEICDNGTCKIFNLDLPDVIAVRNTLLPESERVKNIAADLNDLAWFDRIDATNGVCFLAAGVFYYFKTEQIKRLFPAMAKRFPGGRLVFDAAGKRAVKIMLKTWVKEAGITSISDYFSVDGIETDILPWMEHATVSSRGYMLGYNDLKDPSVPGLFRLMAKIGDGLMKMQIVRMDFTE